MTTVAVANGSHALPDLADIVMPSPPSWFPGTEGWLVLAVVVFALASWLAWRGWRHWRANRYRREALAELARLRADLHEEGAARARALMALSVLLKRCALAAWPRVEVAGLAGEAWHAFLRAHAGKAADAMAPLQALIDAEYRDASVLAAWPAARADEVAMACRRWIAGHRVPSA